MFALSEFPPPSTVSLRPLAKCLLEHQHLLEALTVIEDFVEEVAESESAGGPHWRFRCAQLLHKFILRLQDHFDAEVATTPSERMDPSCLAPFCLAQAQRLNAEHPLLIELFESARRVVLDPDSSLDEACCLVAEAAAALRQHETEEDAVFFAAC